MTNFVLMTPDIEDVEVKLSQDFLNWQKIIFTLKEDYETLKFTDGKNIPIIMENDMIMAKGFWGIVDYFKTEGKRYCSNLQK